MLAQASPKAATAKQAAPRGIALAAEARGYGYLFRVRRTKGVRAVMKVVERTTQTR